MPYTGTIIVTSSGVVSFSIVRPAGGPEATLGNEKDLLALGAIVLQMSEDLPKLRATMEKMKNV